MYDRTEQFCPLDLVHLPVQGVGWSGAANRLRKNLRQVHSGDPYFGIVALREPKRENTPLNTIPVSVASSEGRLSILRPARKASMFCKEFFPNCALV